nr:CoA transferase [Myxococcota bacterium]
TGDDYRYGPSKPGETSLSFQNVNRGKRSITLDVRQDEGRELLLRLCEGADVLVENFRAGFLAKQGLGPEVLQERNPGLVVASLSGFGQTGPRAGEASYDIVAQAAGGFLAMTGFEDGPPVRGGGALADYVGGLYLVVGILAALRDRDRTGRARVLDLSNQDAVFAITDSAASIFHGIGASMPRVGNGHPFAAPYNGYATKDGWMVVATASNKLFRNMMAGIGRPELGTDERFKTHRDRAKNRPELDAILADWMAERTCDEVRAALGPDGAAVPCTKVEDPEDLLEDEQLLSRGMLERHPHPDVGEVLFHGNPVKLSDTEPRERALAPDLGADNEAIYAELGLDAAALEDLRERGIV